MLRTCAKVDTVRATSVLHPSHGSKGKAGRSTTVRVWQGEGGRCSEWTRVCLTRTSRWWVSAGHQWERGSPAPLTESNSELVPRRTGGNARLEPSNRAWHPAPTQSQSLEGSSTEDFRAGIKGFLQNPKKHFVPPQLAAGMKASFSSAGPVKFLALLAGSKETVPMKRHCPMDSLATC